MKRSHLNLCIDIILYLLMMPIIGIGFLMKYVLLNGTLRNLTYGADSELLFWGMDRHQWGSIHLLLSLAFVFFLVWHIVLHWKMMIGMFKNMIRARVWRITMALTLPLVALLLAIVPLFLQPEVQPKTREHHRNLVVNESANASVNTTEATIGELEAPAKAPSQSHDAVHSHADAINGKMTLQELADRYAIDLEVLVADLELPLSAKDEPLGRLKKRYGFDMQELRNYVDEKLK